MKIQEIISFLESIAPIDFQESYDNSGLIVGHPDDNITKALICLDSIESVLDEAIENKCDLIIAHHPIIFQGLKNINGHNYVERVIIKAIKNGIAIYAIHTNLDNVIGGVNSKIAELLELKNQRVLLEKKHLLRKLVVYCPKENSEKLKNALFNAGAGAIGKYNNCSFSSTGEGTFLPIPGSDPFIGEIGVNQKVEEIKLEVIFTKNIQERLLSAMRSSHVYEEISYQIYILDNTSTNIGSGIIGDNTNKKDPKDFLNFLKKKMKLDCIRHTNLFNNQINKVAVCGGSGSFLLSHAKSSGADIFITSDFKYHEFFKAEKDIVIADIGHYESEKFTKELIYDLIINNFPKFAVQLSEVNTNPINYL